ncbi:DcaP family trimeric outer membrane transporter [Bdellovibrio sp. HCB274]|uniref:DcaP family trimeric outer membrane transporter n=1 Tax=Bdellovibrio sp. HCB274 TaxID=3394361 RepID=UPI0039B60BBC
MTAMTRSVGILLMGLLTSASAFADFEIYGFAQLDYVQDFKRTDPKWISTFRPSTIPTQDGQFGSDGQAILSPRQSRLGAQGSWPTAGQNLKARIEFDFFGVGDNAGKVTPRLRHAYGEWGTVLAGQTWSNFMDIDGFPNIVDYWGPTGMVFIRTPQIRYTPVAGLNTVSVALENPSADLDGSLGAVSADNKAPDLSAKYRYSPEWGHLSVSGIVRYLGFDTPGVAGADPKDNVFGWGLNISTSYVIGSTNKLILSAVTGQGIANYMNDGGTDLAADGPPGDLQAKAVPLLGWVVYYDHHWSELWATSIGFSKTEVTNTDFQAANAYKFGEYSSVNMLYTPDKNILMGGEFLYGVREDKNGDRGEDYRLQFTFKYLFNNKWALL